MKLHNMQLTRRFNKKKITAIKQRLFKQLINQLQLKINGTNEENHL